MPAKHLCDWRANFRPLDWLSPWFGAMIKDVCDLRQIEMRGADLSPLAARALYLFRDLCGLLFGGAEFAAGRFAAPAAGPFWQRAFV